MVEDGVIYNPSTDNSTIINELPIINPATGIANFARNGKYIRVTKKSRGQLLAESFINKPKPKEINYQGQWIQMTSKGEYIPIRQKGLGKGGWQKLKAKMVQNKPKSSLFKSLLPKLRRRIGIKDEIKVLRFRNNLEKMRLKNQLERYKLSRRIDLLRKKGLLKPIANQMMQSRIKPWFYPAYSTPMEQQEIDSAFNSDKSIGDRSLWGAENYYDEDFYTEDYYGNEFSGDIFAQLNMKPQQGVSPLFW